jgi:hypothetical protein
MKAATVKKIGVKEAFERRIISTAKPMINGKVWIYGSETERTNKGYIQTIVDKEVTIKFLEKIGFYE